MGEVSEVETINFVKKLRWMFRERMRATPECLDRDVADLFCSGNEVQSMAEKQGRLNYEAGKCHLRHISDQYLMIALRSCWHYL